MTGGAQTAAGSVTLPSQEAVRSFVEELLASGAVDAVEVRVAGPEESVGAGGGSDEGQVFDLASLTKPFVATLALALDADGTLPLDLRLARLWPGADRRLGSKTLATLLRHRSGLAAWAPLYAAVARPAEAAARIAAGEWQGAAPDTYSDLGFILWGASLFRATGRSVEEVLRERVLGPLGAGGVTPGPRRGTAVACALDTNREVELARGLGLAIDPLGRPQPGTPQDGNARFLGGVPGHAGLFGDAEGLVALGREWLGAGRVLRGTLLRRALAGRGRHALGWMRARPEGSAGPSLPTAAFGHTGFTGGSLWIDPVARRIWVLAAHRRSLEVEMNPWRQRFHGLGVP